MAEVSIIGLDLAKHSFQVHGASADGSVLFRKKLSRAQVLAFFSGQPQCIVAMEACATAHDWGRRIGALGREIMLVPPIYVKPLAIWIRTAYLHTGPWHRQCHIERSDR